MKIHLHHLTAAALVAASGSAFAYAEVAYGVDIFHEGPYSSLADSANDPVRAQVGSPGCMGACSVSTAVGFASARADASRLEVGAFTSAQAASPNWGAAANAWAYFENSFTLRSDSLADGTVVQLPVRIGFSGTAFAELGGGTHGEAHLGIVDGSGVKRPGFGEFWQPTLLSFDAGWYAAYAGGMAASSGWGVNLSDGYDANGYELPSFPYECPAGSTTCGWSFERYDTDPAALSYGVHDVLAHVTLQVGQAYTVFGALQLGPTEADMQAYASADFSHTLGASIVDPQGRVKLDWAVPLAPVPEPATWMLMAAGVAFIGWRRRPSR